MPETDDKKIWAAYARNVKPIRKAGPVSARAEKQTTSSAKPQKQDTSVRKKPLSRANRTDTGFRREGILLDRRAERNMRQGLVAIDARLDLHGMRQDEARLVLHDFLARNVKASSRCLLIITGKGRDGRGVLRDSLVDWLASSDYARQILTVRPAAIRHGGEGAFYVLLRKRKAHDE